MYPKKRWAKENPKAIKEGGNKIAVVKERKRGKRAEGGEFDDFYFSHN